MPAPTDFYLETLDYDEARNRGKRYAFSCGINREKVGSSIEISPTPEVVADGQAVGYDIIDPQIGLFHEEQSWHKGAGQPNILRRNTDDDRYATSSGVLPFTEGSFSSGYRERNALVDFGAASHPTNENAFWGANPIWVDDVVYASFGPYLMKWVVTDDTDENGQPYYKFERIATLGENIYSLAYFGGRMYAAHRDAGYSFSDEDDFTSWTLVASSVTWFLSVIRNIDGSFSLARVGNDAIQLASSHPADDGDWAEGIPVGNANENFTSLTAANETVYIGTTRGLYVYDLPAAEVTGRMRNLEPNAGVLQDFARYRHVMPRGGFLWTTRGDESVWRIDDDGNTARYQDIRRLIQFPTFENMTGVVEGLTQDSANIWIAMRPGVAVRGFPYTFPIPFEDSTAIARTARVMVLREDGTAHTITRVESQSIDHLTRVNSFISAQHSNLLILGRTPTGSAMCKMLRIPSDTETPINSAYKQCNPSGYLCTPWMDFFYPDQLKVLSKLSLHVNQVSTSARIKVFYRIDNDYGDDNDESRWTLLSSFKPREGFNNIFPTIEQLPAFRRIRFRIDIINDGNNPLQVNSFVVRTLFADQDFGVHEFTLLFDDSETEDRSGTVADERKIEELRTANNAALVNFIPERNALPSLWRRAQDQGGKLLVRLTLPQQDYLGGGNQSVPGTHPRPVECRIRLVIQDYSDDN